MERVSCPLVMSLLGIFCLITGTGLTLFGVRRINATKAVQIITLRNNSDTFNRWVRPNITSLFKVNIFNVTNPEEVLRGSKPKLMTLGPYVYEQKTEKFDLYKINSHTLSYRLSNSILFNVESSGIWSEKDEVTVINVPLIGAYSSDYKSLSKLADLSSKVFMKTTVKNLLFDGAFIDCSPRTLGGVFPCSALENWPSRFIRKIGRRYKFSFFHHRDGAEPESYVVDTGVTNIKNSGLIVSVNNSNTLDLWESPQCNMINGSDGSQFQVPLSTTDKLYIYDKNFCRSIYAEFERSIVPNGIELFRYVIHRNLFASKEDNSRDKCICQPVPKFLPADNEKFNCLDTGLLPLFPCAGSSIVASLPHFYLGNERYLNFVGLHPSKRRHQTYYDVEPNFGITISSVKRFQYNVDMSKMSEFNATAQGSWVNSGGEIFPILWSEEKAGLTRAYYKQIKYEVFEKKTLQAGSKVLIFTGIILVVAPYPAWFLLHKIQRQIGKLFPRSMTKVFSEMEPRSGHLWDVNRVDRRRMGSSSESELWKPLPKPYTGPDVSINNFL